MLNKRNGEYYGMWCKNGGAGKTDNTSAVYETNNHWGYVWDNQATYDKRFGKHSLNDKPCPKHSIPTMGILLSKSKKLTL